MMASRAPFKPMDTAFAIVFILLLAFALLHLTTVSDMTGEQSVAALRITPELERFRALERDIRSAIEHLEDGSLDQGTKLAILDIELDQIEMALRGLGVTGLDVPGLTRLVEPYAHIVEARVQIRDHTGDVDALLSGSGPLDRALRASLFVVRNNVTRLGDELSATTASLNKFNDRARNIAMYGGLAAVLVFMPLRFMARRAAAKPILALNAATRAVAEERWQVRGSAEVQTDDAVGELVLAFRTMADKLRESREQRAAAFQRTLASLVQTIEAKDTYTSDHSCRVSKYAELLARAVGLSESRVKEIAQGGLIHDIGKIGIPDDIIKKPGKLTKEEFEAIEEHPIIGGRIIQPLDGSRAFLPQIRHHHEHWDGSGYPDGLRGDAIPYSARIIAVADVFEALTSDRPYRQRMSLAEAIAVLREEAGRKLDPDLVVAFERIVLQKINHLLPVSSESGSTADNRVPKRSMEGQLKSLDVQRASLA